MSEPRVVHCKIEPFDFYIGRPSIYGNPYSHKPDTQAIWIVGSAKEAVLAYDEWLDLPAQRFLLAEIMSKLPGKVLGCWCKTKKNPNAPCHGDVLLRRANTPVGQ